MLVFVSWRVIPCFGRSLFLSFPNKAERQAWLSDVAVVVVVTVVVIVIVIVDVVIIRHFFSGFFQQ